MVRAASLIFAATVLTGCSEPANPSASNASASDASAAASVNPSSQSDAPPSSAAASGAQADLNLPPMTAEQKRECDFTDCPAGSAVITARADGGSYFACKTEALTDYTNAALGMISAQKTLTGTVPNIEPDTGEPVYQGETQQLLTNLRGAAGVETFNEAVAQCEDGPHRKKLIVMNFQKDRTSTWVGDPKTNMAFWVPTNVLELASQ